MHCCLRSIYTRCDWL